TDQLAWSSDIQGALGNGTELGLNNLRPGTHNITLVVTNSLGLTGSATVPITVSPPDPAPFSDVHSSDYFYQPVNWLYQNVIIDGYGDNTFRPYNNTTRGQLVKVMVLAQDLALQPGGLARFTDVPASNPFYRYVQTAVAQGIIGGYNDAAHCGT